MYSDADLTSSSVVAARTFAFDSSNFAILSFISEIIDWASVSVNLSEVSAFDLTWLATPIRMSAVFVKWSFITTSFSSLAMVFS